MPKVACIMMQKDERFLLKPWLAYYGYLFGMNNLFVFDNGSTLAEVREMLVEYQAKGVNVNYDYATREHYEAKGEIIGNQIELLDRLGQYDFIIPLDCDEFILLKIDNGFFPSRHHILSYLDSFIGETRVLRFPYQLANHPLFPHVYNYFSFHKVFFAADTFLSIDHGHHSGESRQAVGFRDTDLIHLHFHHKQFDLLIEQAKQKWNGTIDINDREQLADYKGASMHLTQYFLTSKEAYYAGFLDMVHFFLPQLGGLLLRLGAPIELPGDPVGDHLRIKVDSNNPAVDIRLGTRLAPFHGGKTVALVPEMRPSGPWFIPTEFNETLYLLRNDDVAKAGLVGIMHYCTYGFREGRLPNG
jgi:glycosyl transferase family 2